MLQVSIIMLRAVKQKSSKRKIIQCYDVTTISESQWTIQNLNKNGLQTPRTTLPHSLGDKPNKISQT